MIKNEEIFYKKRLIIFSITISIILLYILTFYKMAFYLNFSQNILNSWNIITYSTAIIIFCLLYIFVDFIISKIKITINLNTTIVFITVLLLNCFILLRCIINENKVFDSGSFQLFWKQNYIYTLLYGVSILINSFIIGKYIIIKNRINASNNLFKIISLVSLIFYTFSSYLPNVFCDFFSIYHSNAYFNSIYRVLNLQPYSYINSGIYGFYGILIAPFIKIFGGGVYTCAKILLILQIISLLCLAYVLNTLVKSNIIKLFAVLTMIFPVTSMIYNNYWQLRPHKIIFPCIIMAFMTFCSKRDNIKRLQWIGWLIICLSIIWNIDTGVVCLIAYMGFLIYPILVRYRIFNIEFWINFIIILSKAILTFLLSYITINIYNIIIAKGSLISIHTFLYPLLEDTFVISTELPLFICAWIIEFVFVMFFVANALSKTLLCKIRFLNNRFDALLLSISIIILGQMLYFINRTAYGNLTICHGGVIMLLACFCEHCFWKIKDLRKEEYIISKGFIAPFAYISLAVLIFMSSATVINFSAIENIRTNNGGRNVSSTVEFIDKIKKEVPKDTKAFGIGIAEIYSILNWDAGYYVLDFPDIPYNMESIKYMLSELENCSEPIFVYDDSLEFLLSYDNKNSFLNLYTPQEKFEINGLKYTLYSYNK